MADAAPEPGPEPSDSLAESDIAAAIEAMVARRVDPRDEQDPGQVLDAILHRRVLAVYHAQLSELSASERTAWMLERMANLEARLLALQSARVTDAPMLQTLQPASPPPTAAVVHLRYVEINCDERMSCTGFHETEGEGTSTYRWMDREAMVKVPRVAEPFEVRLYVIAANVKEALDSTRIRVDGGEWTTATPDRQPWGTVLRARPAPGDGDPAYDMRIDIDAGHADSPARHGVNDLRTLSLAVIRTEVETLA